MAITTTLAKLRNYFLKWHETEYDDIHRVTDKIYGDRNNIYSKYAFSSYGASQLQAQINNINLNKYTLKSDFDAHTGKLATKTELGHVKLIDDYRNATTYQDGQALSAYAGYKLGLEVNNRLSKLETDFSSYKIHLGRLPWKDMNTYTPYDYEDIGGLSIDLEDSHNYYGFHGDKKFVTQPGYHVLAVVTNNGNRVGNQPIVISLNGVPYYRKTNSNGTASVKINWGAASESRTQAENEAVRRNWSDTWRWIEATLLVDEADNGFDVSVHKVMNHDPEYFHTQYSQNENLWRNELNLDSNAHFNDRNADGTYKYKDSNGQLRRKPINIDTGYPNSIN